MPWNRVGRTIDGILIRSGSGQELETFYTDNTGTFDTFLNQSSEANELAGSVLGMALFANAQPAANDLSASETAMSEVASSATAMDLVASSATAMDEMVSSSTAMNEIAASTTAMKSVVSFSLAVNKITSSSTAMNEIASSAIAMDEMVSSSTAVNKIASSPTAMESIVVSATGMGKMASSVASRTSVLSEANYDKIFSADVGSDEFFSNSAINPNSGNVEGLPYTYNATGSTNGSYPVSLSTETPSEFDGGNSIKIETDNDENEDQAFAEIKVDLSNADTLKWWAKDTGINATLLMNGNVIYGMGTDFDWTQFSTDISTYDGINNIGLGTEIGTFTNDAVFYTGLELA